MDLKIVVATHKKSPLPTAEIYLPVQVGAALHPPLELPGLARDDEGVTISEKNPNYCELTALYWAWKNLPNEYLGLAHYRRYFVKKGARGDKWSRIAEKADFAEVLQNVDVVLPKKRNYWIETNYSQYIHAHHAQDLDETRAILAEKWPEYLETFDAVMKKTSGHRFNMFVMKKPQLDGYCSWLFDVLFTLEERLDISGYSTNDARVFGFVSERLLDVWLETNHIPYAEMPVVFTEKQNWLKKGSAFLKRKIAGTFGSSKK